MLVYRSVSLPRTRACPDVPISNLIIEDSVQAMLAVPQDFRSTAEIINSMEGNFSTSNIHKNDSEAIATPIIHWFILLAPYFDLQLFGNGERKPRWLAVHSPSTFTTRDVSLTKIPGLKSTNCTSIGPRKRSS